MTIEQLIDRLNKIKSTSGNIQVKNNVFKAIEIYVDTEESTGEDTVIIYEKD